MARGNQEAAGDQPTAGESITLLPYYLLLESSVWVRAFAIQIFVVVPHPLNTARRTKCSAKIHSHSTKNKREFMRRVNILENPSGNLAQLSFL
jgi:hypothetical protein